MCINFSAIVLSLKIPELPTFGLILSSINVNENATEKGFKSEKEDDTSGVSDIEEKTPAKKEVKKRSKSKKGANTPGRSK